MKKWKISEFVLIGLMAAVYGAVTLGVGMLTATLNPILHLFSPAIVALLMGTVVLFVAKKVNKFGALTIFIGVSIALFAGFSGMMYLPFVLTVIAVAFVVDIVVSKLNFKTPAVAIGYGLIQSAYIFGGCIPVLFFLEQNIKRWQETGMDAQTINNFVEHSTGWFLVISMGVSFLTAIIGVYVGRTILKKHFKEID
jgi:energy-coupling factor transport system substrate-specific component